VKRIPIIAVTGFSSAKDRRKSLFEGFDVVINKPATK
jgi:CheY-like chemotaxis protein